MYRKESYRFGEDCVKKEIRLGLKPAVLFFGARFAEDAT